MLPWMEQPWEAKSIEAGGRPASSVERTEVDWEHHRVVEKEGTQPALHVQSGRHRNLLLMTGWEAAVEEWSAALGGSGSWVLASRRARRRARRGRPQETLDHWPRGAAWAEALASPTWAGRDMPSFRLGTPSRL